MPDPTVAQPYRLSWKDAAIAGDFVIAIVLNRYSSVLPFGWILGLVIVALLFTGIWIWRVAATGSLAVHLKNYPLSCLVLLLLCGWCVIQGIVGLEAKMHAFTAPIVSSASVQPAPAVAIPPPALAPTPAPTPNPKSARLTPARPIAPVQPPSLVSTYELQCVGGACAQGSGSQATFNQYGPIIRPLTKRQVATLTNLTPVPSPNYYAMIDVLGDNESIGYAEEIKHALVANHWSDESVEVEFVGVPPLGIRIAIPPELMSRAEQRICYASSINLGSAASPLFSMWQRFL